jgi:hypothetical protein
MLGSGRERESRFMNDWLRGFEMLSFRKGFFSWMKIKSNNGHK